MNKADYFSQAQQSLRDFLNQAYLEAPWRKHVRIFTAILVFFIAGILFSALYLMISSDAATTGREIQDHQYTSRLMQQQNSDMESKIAALSSASEMKRRVEKMSLQSVDTSTIEYVMVPGYQKGQINLGVPAEDIPVAASSDLTSPIITSEYTQSWMDWLIQQVKNYEPLYSFADGG